MRLDRITVDGKEFVAVNSGLITNAWISAAAPDGIVAGTPDYRSGSAMADALWRKAMEQRRPLTALRAEDIYLGDALLFPQESMAALRTMVKEGMIRHKGFPLIADNCAWTPAAWEVYCATGDDDWLREAYRTATATLRAESEIAVPDPGGAPRGAARYLHPLTAGMSYYPAWMEPVDLYNTFSSGVGMWRYAELIALGRMAEALSDKDSAALWLHMASHMREAVNDSFWLPAESRYSLMIYGDYYGLQCGQTDNLANALAVMTGVATPEMGRRIVDGTVALAGGIPLVYPLSPGLGAECNSLVQSMQGIAASMTGNGGALMRALGPLWEMSLDDNAVSHWPALLLRGIFGITVNPSGMAFAPVIPESVGGEKKLSGIPFRDAKLDITIRGTGDRIASFSVDSVPSEHHIFPASLASGRHSIVINMAGNRLDGEETDDRRHPASVTSSAAVVPAVPKVYRSEERGMRIVDFDPELTYDIYVNGILSESIHEADYELPVSDAGDGITVACVTATRPDAGPGFSPAARVVTPPGTVVSIPATAIIPRRPPVHLIPDRRIASRYIEMAPRHNTRMTFYVQAPTSGTYFLRIFYSNGSDETALRSVEVNGRKEGVIVCPAVTLNDWVTVHPSSVMEVTLDEGVNKLSLTYMNSTMLLNRINLMLK